MFLNDLDWCHLTVGVKPPICPYTIIFIKGIVFNECLKYALILNN